MLTDGRTDGRTHGRTDGRTDDGRKVITIAHPEQSSGELKMSRVLFSVWFSIQGIIQNTTCSVRLRKQRIIKKCPGYYSASGSVSGYYSKYDLQRLVQESAYYSKMSRVLFSVWFSFRVLFKIWPAASGPGFSVLLKNVQGIIQSLVHYSGYYSKYDLQHLVQDSAYY